MNRTKDVAGKAAFAAAYQADEMMTAIRIESSAYSPSLNVDDGGRGGLPVVFVHSLAGNTGHWSGQLEHLRGDRRTLAIDLRGHGRSDPARDGDYSVEAMAGDIESVVAALGLRRFVLVGHSMGGSASIEYAGRHRMPWPGFFWPTRPVTPEKYPPGNLRRSWRRWHPILTSVQLRITGK